MLSSGKFFCGLFSRLHKKGEEVVGVGGSSNQKSLLKKPSLLVVSWYIFFGRVTATAGDPGLTAQSTVRRKERKKGTFGTAAKLASSTVVQLFLEEKETKAVVTII